MTYETDRGIFFNPAEVRLERCLKCATPTTRRSPRTIATLLRGGHGTAVIRSQRDVLVLCQRCDRRLDWTAALGFASLVTPIAAIALGAVIHTHLVRLPDSAFFGAFVGGCLGAIAMYAHAVRSSLRVRSIDDDGLIGLDGVHPEVRADLIAQGLEPPR